MRTTVKQKAYKHLAMLCDGYFQILADNNMDYPQTGMKDYETIRQIRHTIYVLCEILGESREAYTWFKHIAKHIPELWEKPIYDSHRKYVKVS